MTEQHLPPLRRRARRTAVITGAVLLLSLSLSPAAQADGGDGLLGGVTGVVGGVTDPVVEPVVEVAQTAVPQPVQQTVAPVVEEVVQPVVSHAEQAVAPVPGAGRATQPVVKAVDSVAQADEQPTEQPGQDGQEAPATGSAPPTATTPAPAGTVPAPGGEATPGPVEGATGPGAAPDGAADGAPEGNGPSGSTTCDGLSDLPPRGGAMSEVGHDLGAAVVGGSSWGVAEAKPSRSGADERSHASRAQEPDVPLSDVPWFDFTGGERDEAGGSIMVPVLSGLVGLLGLTLLGVAFVRARHAA